VLLPIGGAPASAPGPPAVTGTAGAMTRTVAPSGVAKTPAAAVAGVPGASASLLAR
jgi:hypothetical protein